MNVTTRLLYVQEYINDLCGPALMTYDQINDQSEFQVENLRLSEIRRQVEMSQE